MRKITKAFSLGFILAAGVMAAPSLYAQGSQEPSGSMKGHGMMGDKSNKDDGGMMGGMGDMMGMMKMMSGMMDRCNKMMGDSSYGKHHPQEEQKGPAEEPEKKG